MRKLVLSVAILFLLIVLFYFAMNNSPVMDLGSEKAVNRVLGQASKTIGKKYELRCCGSGAAMPGGIVKGLTLSFDTFNVMTRDQLRKILIESSQEFIQIINNNQPIQPFLANIPFDLSNVNIIIFVKDENNRDAYDPEISIASIRGGILVYKTIDKNDDFKFKNRYYESFEEAKQLTQNPSSKYLNEFQAMNL